MMLRKILVNIPKYSRISGANGQPLAGEVERSVGHRSGAMVLFFEMAMNQFLMSAGLARVRSRMMSRGYAGILRQVTNSLRLLGHRLSFQKVTKKWRNSCQISNLKMIG
jgi:hypothetical protein